MFAVRAIFFCTSYIRVGYECGCFLVVRNFSRHLPLRHIVETKSFLSSYYHYQLCLFLTPTVFKTLVFLKINQHIDENFAQNIVRQSLLKLLTIVS